jgi:hypothetical protein
MYQTRKSLDENSIRENPRSEVDLMDCCYVILEALNVIENQPLSLADKIVINDPLLY